MYVCMLVCINMFVCRRINVFIYVCLLPRSYLSLSLGGRKHAHRVGWNESPARVYRSHRIAFHWLRQGGVESLSCLVGRCNSRENGRRSAPADASAVRKENPGNDENRKRIIRALLIVCAI